MGNLWVLIVTHNTCEPKRIYSLQVRFANEIRLTDSSLRPLLPSHTAVNEDGSDMMDSLVMSLNRVRRAMVEKGGNEGHDLIRQEKELSGKIGRMRKAQHDK